MFLLNAGEYEDNYLENSYLNIVKQLRKTIDIPIVVKMARNIGNLPGLIAKLRALGANGVVLFNRFYQLDIDINKMELTAGTVFSKAPSL